MNYPILITGGHVTPAIALIEELKKRGYEKIVFVGRKMAMEGDRSISYEYKEITDLGISFIPITAGRISRVFSLAGLVSILKIPTGFISSVLILLRTKPKVIVSFGGYVAIPIVITGWLMRIHIVTHEQTVRPGLANRVIAHMADAVCISWPQTAKYFPQKKVTVSGNPIRRDLIIDNFLPVLDFSYDRAIIYVCGGSLGSHALNESIGEIVSILTDSYIIIHQTGNSQLTNDYESLTRLRDKLPPKQRKYYLLFPYLNVREVGWVYHHASLVISRAGANTVSELAWFGKPAILVPLPWSGSHEQEGNAQLLVQAGLAVTISQDMLQERLLTTIISMIKHIHEFKNSSRKAKKLVSCRAAQIIADVVEKTMANTRQ